MMHVAVGLFRQGRGRWTRHFFGRDPGRCGRTDLLSGTGAQGWGHAL